MLKTDPVKEEAKAVLTLPTSIAARIEKFLRYQSTGNVTLNIQSGRVLGARIEEILKS